MAAITLSACVGVEEGAPHVLAASLSDLPQLSVPILLLGRHLLLLAVAIAAACCAWRAGRDLYLALGGLPRSNEDLVYW
jgi:hypothetical protein